MPCHAPRAGGGRGCRFQANSGSADQWARAQGPPATASAAPPHRTEPTCAGCVSDEPEERPDHVRAFGLCWVCCAQGRAAGDRMGSRGEADSSSVSSGSRSGSSVSCSKTVKGSNGSRSLTGFQAIKHGYCFMLYTLVLLVLL